MRWRNIHSGARGEKEARGDEEERDGRGEEDPEGAGEEGARRGSGLAVWFSLVRSTRLTLCWSNLSSSNLFLKSHFRCQPIQSHKSKQPYANNL